jgi:hypothetical protein
MALKAKVATLDEVPEAARSFYTEASGGGFALAVEGVVPKEKVDEFRQNNLALKRQNEELLAKFDGIDPDAARELLGQQAQLRERKLIEAGKVDELVQERVSGLIKDHQKTLGVLTQERDGLQQQLHTHLVHGEVRTEALKAGVRAAALDDVILRADTVFRAHEGAPAAFKGKEMLYGKDGVNPLRPAEWIGTLRDTAPHLFEPSTGSGARPGPERTGGNPAVGAKQVSHTDHEAIRQNREGIMKGEIKVV